MTVYDLLHLPSLKEKLHLLSGMGGLDRNISSVTVIDTPDGFNWLRGEEVIITTAYVVSDSHEALVRFMKEIIKKNGSALIIKLERYIKTIPKEALELSEQENFPLIACPGEMAFLDVINPVLSNIISSQAFAIQETRNIHKSFIELAINGNSIPEILKSLSGLIKSSVAFLDDVFGKVYFSNGETKSKENFMEHFNRDCDSFIVASKKQHYGYIIDLDSHPETIIEDQWERNIYQTAIEYASIVIIVRMQTLLSNQMIEEKYRTSFVEDLFLHNVKTEEEIQARAQLYGWSFKEGGFAVIIDINNIKKKYIPNINRETNSRLQGYIDCIFRTSIQFMKQYFPTTQYYMQSDVITFLVCDEYTVATKEKLRNIFRDIQAYLAPIVPFTIMMTVGEYVDRLIHIDQSYKQAQKVIQLGYRMEKFDCIMFYEEIGIYRLLFSIAEKQEAKEFCEKYICPLAEYDRKYHTELQKTLCALVECGWNLKEVSQKLFIHYNSAKYRFQKISEVLDVDLRNPTVHTELEMSIKLYQIMKCP